MKRLISLVILLIICLPSIATTFSYSTAKPQFRSPITSQQLRVLYTDIEDYFSHTNPKGWTFPNTTASNGQILVYNGSLAFKTGYALRSNADVLNTGTGLNGQFLRARGSALSKWDYALRSNVALTHDAGIGTAGQVLQSDGDGTTSWVSSSAPNEWTLKTSNFVTADGGRYIVTDGVTKITVHASSANYDEFWIKPQVGVDLSITGNGITMNGSSLVAGAASTSYTLNENVLYWFVSNGGGHYDVMGILMAR